MGSVWKDTRDRGDGRIRYMIGWKDLAGKWRQKCAGAVLKEIAEAELRRIENEIADARSRGAVSLQQVRPVTFSDFVDKEYLPAMQPPRRRQSTHDRDKQLLENVRPVLGARELRSVGVEDLEKYFAQRATEKTYKGTVPSPAQLNRERQFLSQVFGMARRRRLIWENPVEFVQKLREDNARDRIFTPTEERDVLDKSPEFLRPILSFAINTGMRLGEIVGLKWAAVDRDRGWIYVGQDSKTHKPRQVPINATVDAILEDLKPVFGQEPSSPYVFVNETRRKPYAASSVYNALKAAATRANVFGVVFHTTRHTFVSRMLEAGVPREKVKLITGHRTDSMVDRYKHLEPESAKGATEVLLSPLFQRRASAE